MGDEMNYSENSQKVLCGLFGAVGLMIVLGVLAWSLDTYQFVKNSTSTEGYVVALNAGGSHPQIKFTTADGKEIEYAQNGLIGGYRVGDTATVLYDRENPREASVDAFGALWGFNLLGLILGICFVSIACFKRLNMRR